MVDSCGNEHFRKCPHLKLIQVYFRCDSTKVSNPLFIAATNHKIGPCKTCPFPEKNCLFLFRFLFQQLLSRCPRTFLLWACHSVLRTERKKMRFWNLEYFSPLNSHNCTGYLKDRSISFIRYLIKINFQSMTKWFYFKYESLIFIPRTYYLIVSTLALFSFSWHKRIVICPICFF